MRHPTRTAGPLLIAAVLMAGCGTGPEQPSGADSEPAAPVETTIAPTTTASEAATPAPAQEPPTTTTTTTPVTDVAGGVPDVDRADLDELLAEMEASLAGLDQLMNNAAAGMAAEEGEIIP